ncbi:MAG: HU family DNA-binding protein [Desulfovibrionales bacterium]|uniref:DNA-binding protein HU-beta n=1 Tax=Halodesulfovibrio marinisediminis DSM 17456 TaxID=1121457 RepID=A0A1N6FZY4_9BACT|nr:HU family DNA-binding protein [Halodesulfovibrio marinisediminis]MCG8532060.1 HU family DNA-binding protein [Desulfovibrionales bacterium]SIO00865.1 DNA-binding protein HU-beta [Halodesulfovibrio marinisediminis DSM 17456]
MTKAEFVEKLFAKANLASKSQAETVLESTIETITEALMDGDSVVFTGFGSFKVVERAARKGRNPRTGEEIEIAATKVVKFTPGKTLKEVVK